MPFLWQHAPPGPPAQGPEHEGTRKFCPRGHLAQSTCFPVPGPRCWRVSALSADRPTGVSEDQGHCLVCCPGAGGPRVSTHTAVAAGWARGLAHEPLWQVAVRPGVGWGRHVTDTTVTSSFQVASVPVGVTRSRGSWYLRSCPQESRCSPGQLMGSPVGGLTKGPRAHSRGSLERRGQQLLPVAWGHLWAGEGASFGFCALESRCALGGGRAPAPSGRAAGPVCLRALGPVCPPQGARGTPWPGAGARSARWSPSLILALGRNVGRKTLPCSHLASCKSRQAGETWCVRATRPLGAGC